LLASLDIPTPTADAVSVQVIADDCDREQTCYEVDLEALDTPCQPIVITSVTKTYLGNNRWEIRIYFNQSTPRTTTSTITFWQTNPVIPSRTPDGGTITYTVPLSPTTNMTFNRIPAPGINTEIPSYKGTITDICGNVHSWSV
jgi:hypothetical protein